MQQEREEQILLFSLLLHFLLCQLKSFFHAVMFEYVGYKNVAWKSSRIAFSLVGMLVYCRVKALWLIQ